MELMSFAVPIKEGHDDYLMSLGLAAWAAAGTPPPPESTIIPRRTDPGRSSGTACGSRAAIAPGDRTAASHPPS